jgi:hypothetical protein
MEGTSNMSEEDTEVARLAPELGSVLRRQISNSSLVLLVRPSDLATETVNKLERNKWPCHTKFMLLVAGFPSWRPVFNPRSSHMGFVVH